jgi:hypothetical protein
MGCVSSAERELRNGLQERIEAHRAKVVALDAPALRAWLLEARQQAAAFNQKFVDKQDFDAMRAHGATQALALGAGAAEDLVPYNSSNIERVEHFETLCAMLERVLQLPREERQDPAHTVEITGMAFSKYHDTYGDIDSRIVALEAQRTDLINRWVKTGRDSELESKILDVSTLIALGQQVDVSVHL